MKAGRKSSRKRDAILAYLQSEKSHPTAESIFERLKPEIPDLSLGTVYRNLKIFLEDGMAKSVGPVKGEERYDGDLSPHAHFVCSCCGKVLDIPCAALPESLVEDALSASEGSVEDWSLRFTGVCGKCKKSSV